MGQLIIEVPQNINLRLSIKSVEIANEILRLARKPKKLETIKLSLPDLEDIDENEALGIWSDREEVADEIAREVRESNRRVT